MLPERWGAPGSGRREALAWALEEIAWFAAMFLAAILAARGAQAAGRSPDAAALFAFHGALLAYAALRERTKLAAWFRPTRAALAWGGAVGVAMIATGMFYGTALRVLGVEVPDVAATLRDVVPNHAILVGWGAAAVPLAEELYFRGRLMDGAREALGARAAVAVTAVAFALVHGVPVFIPAYLVFAWLLWRARAGSGGLLAPVIAHAINNLVGLAAPVP